MTKAAIETTFQVHEIRYFILVFTVLFHGCNLTDEQPQYSINGNCSAQTKEKDYNQNCDA